MCFELIKENEEVHCPQCDKVWCKGCNDKWRYQQKYSMKVRNTCPFCRAVSATASEPLLSNVENDRENDRESNATFIENMLKYILSIFSLGLLIALPIIEIATSTDEVAFTSLTLIVLILLLVFLQAYIHRYYFQQQRRNDDYELEENEEYAV